MVSGFSFGWFGLQLRALSPSPSATLSRPFGYFALQLRKLFPSLSDALPFPLRTFGALLREGRGRREEGGRRAGKKVPSDETIGGEGSAGKSCPENYWFGSGVEAINSYI